MRIDVDDVNNWIRAAMDLRRRLVTCLGALLLGLLLMTMLIKVHSWLLVAVAMHFVLVLVTRMAPQLLECYAKHLRQASHYWPSCSPLQKRGLRPSGFGRKEMC